MEMEANGERDDKQMQENEAQKPSPLENGDSVKEKLRALLEKDKADFSAWTSLISEIEKTSLNGIEVIQRMYDAFLSEFPLCYGYWNKYASHVAFYCSLNEVEKVYERAAEALPYSVDLWVSYCSFGMLAYEDPSDVRRLFERGFSFIGKDYMSSLLWDKYIEFEYSQKQWSRLAYVYINTLRFPTKALSNYYISFKKLVAMSDEEMGNTSIETGPNCETTDAEIMNVIRNLKDQHDGLPSPSMLKKYIAVGEILYHRSSQLDEKIKFHEARIQRPYFHVKPLDDCQLENWHQYLDFVELQGDFDWTVKLYERCLIPCAIYSEFWIRYVEFVEAKGGREIANHALQRALKVFFKKVPAFHLYCSMFKEKTGDVNGARATCLRPQLEPNTEFVENVVREANKEKRMGNPETACMVYEKAVEMAKMNQNLQIISIIYVKFARFKFKVSNDIDAAIEVFTRGIQEVPCKSIIQETVNFVSLRGGRPQLQKLDSIIASLLAPESAVSQSLNSYEREEISNMFLEFVDLHGTIDDIMKAWDRHRKLFPHLMKPPFVTWHSPPVRDKPLVNDVVERMRMFASESHQACEGDGPVGSRMLLLDHQSLEDNCSISSKGTAIDKLQGDINDIEVREELIEVTEDVEKNSINDHKGGEEVVQVAEDVEMQSMPKGTDQMVEVTEYLQKLSTNDNKGHVEMVEDTKNEENYSILEQTNALHEAAKKLAHECEGAAQVPETSPEYPKLEHHVPRLLETLSINSTDNRSQRSSATGDHNIPHEATSEARINELLVEGNSMPSQVQLQNSPLHSVCDSTPPESRSTSQVQMQAHDHTTLQQASAVNVYPQNASSAGNWPQMYYVQSSQSQQWHVDPQMQYGSAGATNTQSVVAQGYPYQSQANQIAYAYAQPQSATQPQAQTQVNQQSIYTQNSQGIPPHITQYYQQQQQYHFLQQQNQLASQQPQQLQLQQYQQLIYMQQQQQQQLYLQQQQTYYTQQQQILQQQQFQQLPHQEQQLLLNEHQQQFFQQQQQQFLQLQQQHQRQLQQLQQQQQISASDAKALSSSYILQSSHAQHTSNQDGPEYSEPTIISTEKGDKFQNAEQSGPSISVQADTTPNQ